MEFDFGKHEFQKQVTPNACYLPKIFLKIYYSTNFALIRWYPTTTHFENYLHILFKKSTHCFEFVSLILLSCIPTYPHQLSLLHQNANSLITISISYTSLSQEPYDIAPLSLKIYLIQLWEASFKPMQSLQSISHSRILNVTNKYVVLTHSALQIWEKRWASLVFSH